LQRAQVRRAGCRCSWRAGTSGRDRRSQARKRERTGLLVRRIHADVLLVSSVEYLIVVHAIAHTNRGCALLERIPSQSDARGKVTFRSFDDVLAVGRDCRCAIYQRLRILRVDDQAVAEIAAPGDTVSGAGYQRRGRSCVCRWIEVRQKTVLVVWRAEIGIAHAVIEGDVSAEAPFVLRITFECLLAQISRQVITRLTECQVSAHQEISPE